MDSLKQRATPGKHLLQCFVCHFKGVCADNLCAAKVAHNCHNILGTVELWCVSVYADGLEWFQCGHQGLQRARQRVVVVGTGWVSTHSVVPGLQRLR